MTPSLQAGNNCLLKLEALSCENCKTIFEGEKTLYLKQEKDVQIACAISLKQCHHKIYSVIQVVFTSVCFCNANKLVPTGFVLKQMNSFHLLQLTDNLPSSSTYFFPVFNFPHLYLFLVLVSFCCCCSFSSFIVLLFPLVAACTISRPFLLALFLVKRVESFAKNR